MRITYDREVGALSIGFIETTVTTKHRAEGSAADDAPDGRLAGLEILDVAKRYADPAVLRDVVVQGLTARGHRS
jgi:hypothetical protein